MSESKVALLVRMSPADKAAIQAAARAERLSMSAFFVRSATRAAQTPADPAPAGLDPEAEAAVEALIGLGEARSAARRAVSRCRDQMPVATAEDMLRAILRGRGGVQ